MNNRTIFKKESLEDKVDKIYILLEKYIKSKIDEEKDYIEVFDYSRKPEVDVKFNDQDFKNLK
jgi:hypothetical protein